MSWLRVRRTFELGLLLAGFFWLSGCGVKGDPVPPERPPNLGRGRPTYKRATEDIKIERRRHKTPGTKDDKDKDEEGDSNDGE